MQTIIRHIIDTAELRDEEGACPGVQLTLTRQTGVGQVLRHEIPLPVDRFARVHHFRRQWDALAADIDPERAWRVPGDALRPLRGRVVDVAVDEWSRVLSIVRVEAPQS